MIHPDTRRHTQIGLDRLVRLEWLEQTASLVLANNDSATIKTVLQASIKDSFRSADPTVRGSMDKTITILAKVWSGPPTDLVALRLFGIELLQHFPAKEHLPIHWGMMTAVYPFWASVATQVGRLLNLQGSATVAQVQRRVREQYGERETVSRRVRYALRSYLDWGVLQGSGTKGIYTAGATLAVDDSRLIAWLVEACLHARSSGSAPLKDLLDSPSLFPFRLKAVHTEGLLSVSSGLDVLRHGLSEELVMLKKQQTKGDSP